MSCILNEGVAKPHVNSENIFIQNAESLNNYIYTDEGTRHRGKLNLNELLFYYYNY